MTINPLSGTGSVQIVSPPTTTQGTENESFSSMVGDAVENLVSTQNKADDLSMQAATGQLTDIHDLTIATTEATLATQLTVAVRNKALEAFNEIMRMPV